MEFKKEVESSLGNWDEIGFLEGLSPEDKLSVAKMFEEVAIYLITNDIDTKSSGTLETLIFPAIRRVYTTKTKEFDVIDMVMKLRDYINDSLSEYGGFKDPEIELLKSFIEDKY